MFNDTVTFVNVKGRWKKRSQYTIIIFNLLYDIKQQQQKKEKLIRASYIKVNVVNYKVVVCKLANKKKNGAWLLG